MRKIIIALAALLLVQLVSAQSIRLQHLGYSDNNEATFALRNIGDVPIRDVKLLLDEKDYKILNAYIEPNRTVQFSVAAEQGRHTLAACFEDICAVTSFDIAAPKTESVEGRVFLEDKKVMLSIIILVLIVTLVVWLVKIRARL